MIHPASEIKMFTNRADFLRTGVRGASVEIIGMQTNLIITDRAEFKGCLPTLAANVADFGEGKSAPKDVRKLSAWIIGEAAQQMGAKLNSPQELYVAIAEGRIDRAMTIPAVNIRANSLDTARALFRAANDNNVGALIFEIARSEMGYTNQKPMEFAAVVQAAAILEGFKGPLFLQGDHIQLKAAELKKGGEAAEKEIKAHSALIRDAILNGFGSIDLDMSPLEMRDREDLPFDAQQAENAKWTARKIQEVRTLTRELGIPWTLLLGGETGEVGKMNTRPEDLKAYANGILTNMREIGIDPSMGIRKIAVNDGTSHGGIALPDGSTAKVAIEFGVLEMATKIGREFGWAGSVQHGASTLPDDAFNYFPKNGAVEVHLATAYQMVLLKAAEQIEGFKPRLIEYLKAKHAKDWKADMTDEQNWRSSSKNITGPFKYEFWTMPEEVRAAVAEELYKTFTFLFGQFNVKDTKDLVQDTVTDRDFHRPFPEEEEVVAVAQSDSKGPSGDSGSGAMAD